VNQYSPEVVQTINNILNEKFEVAHDKMIPTALLKDDLNLDSLDFVDMFVLLEEKLGQTPQNIDFMKIKTLGDIYQMVMDINSNGAKN
jgi:acyl carrier protein